MMDSDAMTVITSGCTYEIKKEEVDKAAVDECVYDMYGAGTKLATMALQSGKIVDKVYVYGLVVAMDKMNAAKLLMLEMNFAHSTCNFRIACQEYDFLHGTNLMLHKVYSKY